MLSGKTAFITGSNRGIGKAVLDSFIKNRANIICAVRKCSPEFKDYIIKISEKFKSKIKILEFDLENERQTKAAIHSLYKEKITLDILVNNAGVADGSLLEMTSTNNLKKIFQINFFSQIRLTQLLLRLLKKSKNGSIINLGSISGIIAERGTLSYGSSKAALMFSTKVMAKELSVYKIRVNCIAPTATDTDMLNQMDKVAKEKLLQNSLLKKQHTAAEVASKVLFLASEKSIHINVQIVKIDEEKNN